MPDSANSHAAPESCHTEFSHGLLDIRILIRREVRSMCWLQQTIDRDSLGLPIRRSVGQACAISVPGNELPPDEGRRDGTVGITARFARSSGFRRKAIGYLSGLVFSSGSVERQE